MDILTFLGKAFASGLLTIGALLGGGGQTVVQGPSYGDFNPSGGTTYRLASSIGTTDTSIRLSSFKEPVSEIPYTMSYLNTSIGYGTLDPQNSRSEFISFTGITQNSNGTAILTGVTRGLARSPGASATGCTTASSTLRQSHSGQSIFILSDSPCFFSEYAVKQNDETITGAWLVPTPTVGTQIANKDYVDGKTFGGIGNASETATGTVEIATAAEAAAGTTNGTLGRLALPSSLSTSTWTPSSATGNIPTLGSGGKLDNNFISTSTLFGTSSIQNTAISGVGKNVQVFSSPGTTTFSVPSNVTRVKVITVGGGGGGGGVDPGSSDESGGGGGGGGACAIEWLDLTGTSTVQVFVGSGGAGGLSTPAAGSTGTWSTFGTNGFYNSAGPGVGGGADTSPAGGTGGVASGGTINITGQGGGAGSPSFAGTGSVGAGGNSCIGGGGSALAVTAGATGTAGGNYGGGGGGAPGANGTANAGGAGANGVVIVEW